MRKVLILLALTSAAPPPTPADYQQCATVQGPPLVQEKHINGDAPVSPLV
jgi:hypothetical protein